MIRLLSGSASLMWPNNSLERTEDAAAEARESGCTGPTNGCDAAIPGRSARNRWAANFGKEI